MAKVKLYIAGKITGDRPTAETSKSCPAHVYFSAQPTPQTFCRTPPVTAVFGQ